MSLVAVLMSTYNGEKYLREQLDSILSQQDVEVSLFIRDDGSRDGTVEILEEYVKGHRNIHLIKGENMGVGNSFMSVLKSAKREADYFAFADQDDIWMPLKLREAVLTLDGKTVPCCYCSNQTLVDKTGAYMRDRHSDPIDTGYMQILCNNEVTGCTMVWNRQLQGLLMDERRFPSADVLKKRIHDVWVAMVASVVGELYYDQRSFIQYRQHENNVVGVRKSSLLREWKKKLRNPALRNGRSALAGEIVEKYGDLIRDRAVKERLRCYADYRKKLTERCRLLRDGEICAYSGESPVMLRLKILLGLF